MEGACRNPAEVSSRSESFIPNRDRVSASDGSFLLFRKITLRGVSCVRGKGAELDQSDIPSLEATTSVVKNQSRKRVTRTKLRTCDANAQQRHE
jgi:hypothetical protein